MPYIAKDDKSYFEVLRNTYIQALRDKKLSKKEVEEELDFIRDSLKDKITQ